MSEFTSTVAELKNYDSFKRVAYPPGMLLTPTEFLQEQFFFNERDRLHHRLLHGYGTVCGLKVEIKNNDKVWVGAGLALDTLGRLIRVQQPQCASLGDWLTRYGKESPPASPSAVPPDFLYVVLCYRECPSDKVLIRTSPCRPEQQSEDYSRVQESFELKLATKKPAQDEEEAIRELSDILSEIEVSAGAAPLGFIKMQSVRNWMRDRVLDLLPDAAPPASPMPVIPVSKLHPADAEKIFKYALQVWVTEVKPALMPGGACMGSSKEDSCILLAKLEAPVDPQTWKINGAVTVDETDRPVFISTRLLQEIVLNRL